MNKGEKSSQATYTLMDSYLTAPNQQKELWDTIDSSRTRWLSSDQKGRKKSRIIGEGMENKAEDTSIALYISMVWPPSE